jgi:putative heme-binding domain-containing protein
VRELGNEKRSPEAHTLALAHLKPDNKYLTLDRLSELLRSKHDGLRLEAIRTLAQQSNDKRFELLMNVAEDDSQSEAVRAEAIVGLAGDASKNRTLLETLAASDRPKLVREAKRALRLAGFDAAPPEAKPPADGLDAWTKLVAKGGDAGAGRRLFFSPIGPKCSVCHTYAGRGGNIGPELTHIGGSTSRERIIASILEPSREIAPDYQPWVLVTTDGKSYTGLLGIRGGVSEKEEYIDDAGKTFTLHASDIESRQASTKSIMPDNLQATLTVDDLRDLVTFLASPDK